jgi:ATP-dependent Clp protease protease subunit
MEVLKELMTKRIAKDWVNAYFEHGVDVSNRRIFLDDEISDCSISNVIKGIYLMEGTATKQPVSLYMSSFGGDMYEMFALYDILRTVECEIHTFAYGKCMSATPLLLACGEIGHRWCSPNCWFMIHDSWGFAAGSTQRVVAEVDHWKDMNNKWAELLGKETKKAKKFWIDKCTLPKDYFFNSDKAIAWGVADHIWDQKEGE